MLRALKLGAASAGTLALLVTLGVSSPADPEARRPAEPAQRHTSTGSPTATPSATGTPTPGSTTGAPQAPIVFAGTPDPEPAALRRFYDAKPAWAVCKDDDEFQCATVTVPIDHAKPDGGTVGLALRRLPAREPDQRRGTLFINPGGPGGSGVDFAAEAESFFGDAVLDTWDVVGWDPRGMGESEGFDCLTDRDLDRMYAADLTPRDRASRARLEQAAKQRVSGCLRRGGELARNMGTEAVARDLDILRAVVGDERLNYYGVSYGTLIGSVYADLFTSRVGLMVLDSAVSPDGLDNPDLTQGEIDESARYWALDFDERFDNFVEACNDEDVGCFLGDDVEKAAPKVLQLLDRLERRPMTTAIESLPQLTEGWAVVALSEGLRDPESWEYLVQGLEEAVEDGNGSALAWFAMASVGREEDGTYPGATFGKNHLPVTCADWPATAWDRAKADPKIAERHPLWARVEPDQAPECLGWQGTSRETLLVGAEPATPVLIIGNEGDSVTPFGNTEYLASMIVRSRLVPVDADVHGAYGAGNSCIDEVVDEYLADGVPPPFGTEC